MRMQQPKRRPNYANEQTHEGWRHWGLILGIVVALLTIFVGLTIVFR